LGRGELIDIIDGHSRKVLADWLFQQPSGWIERIEVAALDPFRGYGAALSRAAQRGTGAGCLPRRPVGTGRSR